MNFLNNLVASYKILRGDKKIKDCLSAVRLGTFEDYLGTAATLSFLVRPPRFVINTPDKMRIKQIIRLHPIGSSSSVYPQIIAVAGTR
jgi:hypothetical protein